MHRVRIGVRIKRSPLSVELGEGVLAHAHVLHDATRRRAASTQVAPNVLLSRL